jgi:amino acid transporter
MQYRIGAVSGPAATALARRRTAMGSNLHALTRRKTMRKVILTFGLIAGAIISVFLFIFIAVWENSKKMIDSELVGYATMVIALSMVFFGIKSYRDNYQKGAIKFWKGFQVGLLISLIASLMYAITWETYMQVRPASYQAFVDYYIECQINKKKEKGASAAEIDQEVKRMDDFRRIYSNTAIRLGITLMEILPVGIIIALISAAVLRKKDFLPA